MPRRSRSDEPDNSIVRQQPATTPEEREQQMIGYADQLAEKQLLDGSASAQVISHYLKLGSTRERLEQTRIHNENLKLQAQIAQIQSQQRTEELVAEVKEVLMLYGGISQDG